MSATVPANLVGTPALVRQREKILGLFGLREAA